MKLIPHFKDLHMVDQEYTLRVVVAHEKRSGVFMVRDVQLKNRVKSRWLRKVVKMSQKSGIPFRSVGGMRLLANRCATL